MEHVLLAALGTVLLEGHRDPTIHHPADTVRQLPHDSGVEMVIGAPKDKKIDSVYVLWLIRGGGRNILFDSDFHRARWFKEWTIED